MDEHGEDQDSVGSAVGSAASDGATPPPTIGEVKDAIKNLMSNGIVVELIKMVPNKLANCLHRLIAQIWDTEHLSEWWKNGVIWLTNWTSKTIVRFPSLMNKNGFPEKLNGTQCWM